MRLEFGRPTDVQQALIRMPNRQHPDYVVDDGPYQHCAHFRDFVDKFVQKYSAGGTAQLPIDWRMMPLEVADLRLLFQLNSFRRKLEGAFTEHWAAINPESSWADLFPSGDNEYRWWQITTLDPDVSCGEYRLYCIEINNKFSMRDSNIRFNDHSEFETMFATEDEINSLKEAIVRSLR